MAYFEVRNLSSYAIQVRIRELSESPSAYSEFYVDFVKRSGSGGSVNNDVPGSFWTYYSDGTGYYQTNWGTFYIDADTRYNLFVAAMTNRYWDILYEDGSLYYDFWTPSEEPDVPYPDVTITRIIANEIRISWDAISGADSYDIFLDGNYYGSRSASQSRTYVISDLTPNTYYSITMTAWVGNTESNYGFPVLTSVVTAPRAILGLSVSNVTNTSARASWSSRAEATSYEVRLYSTGIPVQVLTTTSTYYNFTNLLSGIEYRVRVSGVNSDGSVGEYSDYAYFTTLASVTRPLNWAWEYTIASGQSFYTQSGSTVYIMRASHWNAFTARINEFRLYKLGPGNAYSFTTAVTSHTESQIRACVNQAITAINAMGFSQSSVSSGSNVAASTFTTMRNNLNSIT